MTGKRVYDKKPWELAEGEYMKGSRQPDGAMHWWLFPPGGEWGTISDKVHQVTEHHDGTITVSPSILYRGQKPWHGYLVRGVWRTL